MVTYLNPPFVTDPDDLTDDALDYLAANIPGWEAHDGSLPVWMIMALSRISAVAADVGSAVPISIFRYYGSALIGLQSIDAVKANTTTTWTMVDDQGYTIEAGTNVAFRVAGDTLVPFVTIDDVVIPPGETVTGDGAVIIEAADPGAAGNGLGPAGIELLDALAYVDSITAVSATTGGVDAEDDSVYIARLIDFLRLMTPRPIHAVDFAVLARQVAGVVRSTGLDNYDPSDGSFDNERMVGVALIDADGQPVSAPIKTLVDAYLQSLRETNFIINIFDPEYTVINVNFSFTEEPTYVKADVAAAAVDAVTAYLSPGNWGKDPTDQSGATWNNETVVRYNELVALLNGVPGLKYLDMLTVNGGTANVNLAGDVALPEPGAIAWVP